MLLLALSFSSVSALHVLREIASLTVCRDINTYHLCAYFCTSIILAWEGSICPQVHEYVVLNIFAVRGIPCFDP